MASPYRGGADATAPEIDDDGIVGDLVRQFADPYAFYRELVQNAIDAEASKIDVRITPRDGGLRASVRDDGQGMDPDVLENQLLVLFRSGKEGQQGKIGKFGVGFVSVLAIQPERVVVQTSKGDGITWTLHLFPDHRYELFEAGGGDRAGTTVSLDLSPASEKLGEIVSRSKESLRRWCRHASIPIMFRALEEPPERIDEPLSLRTEALIEVSHQEGSTHVTIGLPTKPGGFYAGFFNHGLTLFESTQPFEGPLGATCFKVQDPALEHTLSRDNVRRDSAFRRALEVASRALHQRLVPALQQAIHDAAAERELPTHRKLLARLRHESEAIPLDRKRIVFPLLHGDGVVALGELNKTASFALAATPLTRALQHAGHPVVVASHLDVSERELLRLPYAEQHATLVRPVDAEDHDGVLLDQLVELLTIYRKPSGIQLVELWGVDSGALFVGGPMRSAPWVNLDRQTANPFRRLLRPALLLNTRNSIVSRARALAERDPEVAAALLARELLRLRGALTGIRDLDLTESALAKVLGAES